MSSDDQNASQPTPPAATPAATPAESTADSSVAAVGDPALQATQTTLARRWVLRVIVILVIGWGLFIWGVVDAVMVYPNRGRDAASYLKYQYLREVEKAKTGNASVDDPDSEFTRLEAKKKDNTMSPVESARFNWLQSLDRVGDMKSQQTRIADTKQELKDLDTRWGVANVKVPQPLEGYDIPSQWAIAAIGLVIGVWRLVTFIAVAAKKYGWDPATSTITLPGGATLNEADITEYDKRKWDKFIITLGLRDGHATGKKDLTLDLYPYTQLEPWVLELERRGTGSVSEPPKD